MSAATTKAKQHWPKRMIDRLREDGIEFLLNSNLVPTLRFPEDPHKKDWEVGSARVQDYLVRVHFELCQDASPDGDPAPLSHAVFQQVVSLINEECREGRRILSEDEAAKIDSDVYLQAATSLMNLTSEFRGRTADLMKACRKMQQHQLIAAFPELPFVTNIFSREMRRRIPVLREHGIDFSIEHREDGSYCTVKRSVAFAVEPAGEEVQRLVTDALNGEPSGTSSVATPSRGTEMREPDDADGVSATTDPADAKAKLGLPGPVPKDAAASKKGGSKVEVGR